MSQSSEDRVPQSAIDAQEPARILPFERPLSELQRSIQWRAQTANDVQREREREAKRPRPLKWLIIFLLALVPVVMIFGALDAFLRLYYRLTEQYLSAPVEQSLPAASEPLQSEPGVVLLRPYEVSPVDSSANAPAASPAAGSKPESVSPESGGVAPSQIHDAARPRPGDRSNRSAEEAAAGRDSQR